MALIPELLLKFDTVEELRKAYNSASEFLTKNGLSDQDAPVVYLRRKLREKFGLTIAEIFVGGRYRRDDNSPEPKNKADAAQESSNKKAASPEPKKKADAAQESNKKAASPEPKKKADAAPNKAQDKAEKVGAAEPPKAVAIGVNKQKKAADDRYFYTTMPDGLAVCVHPTGPEKDKDAASCYNRIRDQMNIYRELHFNRKELQERSKQLKERLEGLPALVQKAQDDLAKFKTEYGKNLDTWTSTMEILGNKNRRLEQEAIANVEQIKALKSEVGDLRSELAAVRTVRSELSDALANV